MSLYVYRNMDIMDSKKKAVYNYRKKLKEENGERLMIYMQKQREYAKKHYIKIKDTKAEEYEKHKEKMRLNYYRKMSEEELDYTLSKLKIKNPEKYDFIKNNL